MTSNYSRIFDPRYVLFYGYNLTSYPINSKRLLFGEILVGSCFLVFFITITWGFVLVSLSMVRHERKWTELRKLYAADILNSINVVTTTSSRPPMKDKPSVSLVKPRPSPYGGKELFATETTMSGNILHVPQKVKGITLESMQLKQGAMETINVEEEPQ